MRAPAGECRLSHACSDSHSSIGIVFRDLGDSGKLVGNPGPNPGVITCIAPRGNQIRGTPHKRGKTESGTKTGAKL